MSHHDRQSEPLVQITHPGVGEDSTGGRKSRRLEACATPEAGANAGKQYWRGLEELAETPEFLQFLQREFPQQASEWNDPVGRRMFLRLMAASLGLAGLGGCSTQPAEHIVPYVKQPEETIPGKPLFFATAMTLSGVATGLLARSNEGRPTKIEGNARHPGSLGATDSFCQAAILELYDPDRSQAIRYRGEISSWSSFLAEARSALEAAGSRQGAGLRLLTETVVSPTLADQIQALLKTYPTAKWHQYDPIHRDSARRAAAMVFGRPVNTIFHFDRADRILSLDADFLSGGPGTLQYVRQFAGRRRVEGDNKMNRLYAVECTATLTGAAADHRLAVAPSEMEEIARLFAAALGSAGAAKETPPSANRHARWIQTAAEDLAKHPGSSLVVAGDQQPPIIHALAHMMNQRLNSVGATVTVTDPVEASPIDQIESLGELSAAMEAGQVELLVMLGGNPVYNTPADLKFGERLGKVTLRIHLSQYHDETSELCHWHIPQVHFLESWSDTRAFNGMFSVVQPLIEPLYGGRSAHQMVAFLAGQAERSDYEIVRDYWKKQWSVSGDTFERRWRQAVHDGIVESRTGFQPVGPSTAQKESTGQAAGATAAVSPPKQSASPSPSSGFEIVFRPDPTIYDGRFANNGWLQELPKPLTKLTWDNAAMISPASAERLGLSNRLGGRGGEYIVDVVELEAGGRKLRAPVWILAGQPDNCVTIHLGYGRRRAGRVGNGAGFNAYLLQTSDSPWSISGASVRKTGETFRLASTQVHQSMEGRDLVRSQTLNEYQQQGSQPAGSAHASGQHDSLYPPVDYPGYAWGMAVDLNTCIGCSGCVVACQSENNIPIVGKEQVARSREMHWLRIDRYYEGPPDNPSVAFQPVLCMHCENAPCEVVCPVAATVHSAEGLNDMVYNRCVGTRYCSHNCPYKVRRFNFLLYSDWETPSLKLMRNPEVTVRSRGVMEKCSYCVQRIASARIESEKDGRRIRDGEIVTACQAACPAEAIVFGDINDPNSRVAKLKAGSRNYSLLDELNVRPRTTYLAAVRNPNPDLETG
ncbi:MAG: TAT-variant-translocated molybdopterin oxidoreductase [Acidobacteriota bacterium]